LRNFVYLGEFEKEKSADTTAEKNKIDVMVYKLYNLTYSEVKIIDHEIEKTLRRLPDSPYIIFLKRGHNK